MRCAGRFPGQPTSTLRCGRLRRRKPTQQWNPTSAIRSCNRNNGSLSQLALSYSWFFSFLPHGLPIEGLTKALAEELPPGMAAIPLSPGVIDTDMLRQAWGDGASGYRTAGYLGIEGSTFYSGSRPTT